jgi:HlyD family type I secretion membrane fusion protein
MSGLLSLRSRAQRDALPAIVGAFESETQAVIARSAPYSDRMILHGLGVLLLVALLLMSVLKLDRVVVATGKVVPTTGSLYIQPLDRAIVRSVQVRVGDVVRKGQVLAILDPTFAAADAANLQAKHDSDAAMVARLEAEQAGVAYAPKGNSPAEMLQLAAWRQRQADYRANLLDFDARMAASATVISKSAEDARNYDEHRKIAADIERRMRELEATGYGAPLKTLAAQDTRVEADRQLAEARGSAVQGSHDLAALRAQRDVFITKWRDDLATALVAARNDLNQSTQDLIKADRVRDLTSLTAPADGVVLQIGNVSTGSVVDAPQGGVQPPLFTLTPLGGAMEADVAIPARDIGFVKRGDTVRVKLDAYRFLQHGTAEAVVKTISEGAFTTDDNQRVVPPYFKAKVAFTKVGLRNVPADFRLIPGMTLTGDILVGHRTIMSYIVEGALRTGSEAMREP